MKGQGKELEERKWRGNLITHYYIHVLKCKIIKILKNKDAFNRIMDGLILKNRKK